MWDYKTASPDRYQLLKQFARDNRNHATNAEKVLWSAIRGRQIAGKKFLRQHVVGDYIADFICEESGLIIEVDGGYHSEPRQLEDDNIRTARLEEMGFHVIRFTNDEVLFDYERVIEEIESFFN